ncbi:ASCH domain-containing protein [Bacillus vallismortis]|uniref:ASCH domain-containing protein n=1 Tax=Bacillus vallismortis TaxID=72361 RepID=A0AAP3FVW6_BACVA|nr:ASCH domain-containing protein [Bacillus vallismortis]MCY8315514.1 ASCH domain-containing protein [Bacillus vallismortis]MEC1650546.1 ASCH domain-containing protein [Bacillus vallismortis]
MKIYELKSTFGWEGDDGLGEQLIQQILAGEKTATCAPKSLYSKDELSEVYQTAGQLVTVYDKDGNPRCNIKVTDVFETTFGAPDMRLVKGEGNEERIEEFQKDHLMAWAELIQNGELELNEDTVLITELFKLVHD